MQRNVVGQCILLAVLMMISLQVAALMMIDMNGPDIEAVDEVKSQSLESVHGQMEELQEEGAVKGQSTRGRQGVRVTRSVHTTRNVYSQLSGLEDVSFNDFIKKDFIPEGHGQVASGSASLPDPVALETEEQTLERE